MGRVLGLDYGRKRVGVAVSDPLGLTAQPMDTWTGFSDRELVEKIRHLISDQDIHTIVIGEPKTLKGEKKEMSVRVFRFVALLRQTLSIPVCQVDERFTSVIAEKVLRDSGLQPSRHKEKIDRIAAVLILQTYLDMQ